MRTKIIFPLLILPLMFFACFSGGEDINEQDTNDILVTTASVELRTINNVLSFSGILMPIGDAKLGSQLTSEVKKIHVKEGDFVKRGKVLASLSKANLDQAKAQFTAIENEWLRVQSLFESGSVTRSAYDQAKAQYDATKAGLAMAEENTIIKAPFDGEILDIAAKEGQIFSPMMPGPTGTPYLIHLVADKVLKMEITVSDKEINRIKEGQKVVFSTDAIDSNLTGYVYSVTKAANHISGSFSAILYLENTVGVVPSGIFSNAEIITQSSDSALVVLQDAIVSDSILFKIENGKAKLVKTDLGITNGKYVQVFSTNGISLGKGDSVIVEGNIGMQDNRRVKVARHLK